MKELSTRLVLDYKKIISSQVSCDMVGLERQWNVDVGIHKKDKSGRFFCKGKLEESPQKVGMGGFGRVEGKGAYQTTSKIGLI